MTWSLQISSAYCDITINLNIPILNERRKHIQGPAAQLVIKSTSIRLHQVWQVSLLESCSLQSSFHLYSSNQFSWIARIESKKFETIKMQDLQKLRWRNCERFHDPNKLAFLEFFGSCELRWKTFVKEVTKRTSFFLQKLVSRIWMLRASYSLSYPSLRQKKLSSLLWKHKNIIGCPYLEIEMLNGRKLKKTLCIFFHWQIAFHDCRKIELRECQFSEWLRENLKNRVLLKFEEHWMEASRQNCLTFWKKHKKVLSRELFQPLTPW